MNLYRGCTHGCIYCDSRSKCYQMPHDFEDVEVKKGSYELKGKFALNLCPNEESMGEFKQYAAYRESIVNDSGTETTRVTAKDMCVMFFNTKDTEEGFEYESLLYVVHLIEKYNKAA